MKLAVLALAFVSAQAATTTLPKSSPTTTTLPKSTPTTATTPKGGKGGSQAPTKRVDLSKLDPNQERLQILAEQVDDVIANARSDSGDLKGTVVDLVISSMNNPVNVTCNVSSSGFKTCAEGYNSLDCVFSKDAATFGGVNCIPYFTSCADALMAYCRSKVPNNEKCKATNACACADETGCGWSRGHMMCLTGRPLVSCGDCANMTRCGAVNCVTATRPCDCVALGGMCGWSTSSWRCESGKDTDCNECADQIECGGAGVALVNSALCPKQKPAQLSPCKQVITCPYDTKCCDRCAGQKQVCASNRASCDGKYWEVTSSSLVCPDCDGYYYDDGYYSDDAPTAPLNVTATAVTSTTASLSWLPPKENFKAGKDGYSVAYALANTADDDIVILNVTTKTTAALQNLRANTNYKVSILPITTDTEAVGEPAHFTFKTAAGSPTPKGKKAAKAKAAKAPTKAATKGRR